ncbi:MAG TPA: cyclic nucleotide-binding domain-containing protein [Candidatus Sulfotelmatobacter sp.]|nr:cyclic nucleotide-binding domain-containing protein [Candidatus Sulfotelmatobacter sp.]
MDAKEQLQSISLFSTLTPAELTRIAPLVADRRVAAGTVVCREGEAGHELYLIVKGEAAVEKAGAEVARLGPGEVLGELALLDRAPRSATVTAASDLTMLVLSEQDFAALLDEIPSLPHRLLQVLARRLRDTGGGRLE